MRRWSQSYTARSRGLLLLLEHKQGRRQAPRRRRLEEGEAAVAEAAEEAVRTSRWCRARTNSCSVVGALMSYTQAWCLVQGWAL